MACCGSAHTRPASTKAATGPVTFEYSGSGPFTIFGRATGMRYHFPGPGSRVVVDARDARLLQVIKGLEAVDPPR